MDTISINSKNSKASDPHRRTHTDKIDLKISDKYFDLSNRSI